MNNIYWFAAAQERLTELYLGAEAVRQARQRASKPHRQLWEAVLQLAHWRVIIQVRRTASPNPL